MKNKIIQFIPVVLALTFIGFRYFSNWCIFRIGVCYGTTISHISLTITKPLYNFSIFFIPLTIILVFISRNIFNSWLKFAVWALPLAFIYIAMTPVWDSSWLPFARDDAARLAGVVFSTISLIIIAYCALRSTRTK